MVFVCPREGGDEWYRLVMYSAPLGGMEFHRAGVVTRPGGVDTGFQPHAGMLGGPCVRFGSVFGKHSDSVPSKSCGQLPAVSSVCLCHIGSTGRGSKWVASHDAVLRIAVLGRIGVACLMWDLAALFLMACCARRALTAPWLLFGDASQSINTAGLGVVAMGRSHGSAKCVCWVVPPPRIICIST